MSSLSQTQRDLVRKLLYALDVEGFTVFDMEISAEPELNVTPTAITAEASPHLNAVRVKKNGVGKFRVTVMVDPISGLEAFVEQMLDGVLESNPKCKQISKDLRARLRATR